MALNKVIKFENPASLSFSGSYTFSEVKENLSAGYQLHDYDTGEGYYVDNATFSSTANLEAFCKSYYLVDGANKSGAATMTDTKMINSAVIYRCYQQNGNQVPYYIPVASLKIGSVNDTDIYLYYGVKVTNVTNPASHSKETGIYLCNGPDANTATSVTLLKRGYNGGTNRDFIFGFGMLYSHYFRQEGPEGETSDDESRDICIRFAYNDGSPGTLSNGSPIELTWSSNSSRAVSFTEGYLLCLAKCWALYGYLPASSDPGPSVGPISHGGVGYGTGTFANGSDTIALPSDPVMGVTSAGFVRVYNIGSGGLQSIGFELFPPLAYTPPVAISAQDTTEAIINGFNQIVTFLANIPSFFDQIMANTLINYVIDCHVIPVNPGSGSTEYIHVGPKTLQTQAARVTTDYVNVSCGAINVGEYYANFADFVGTSAKLYLPFIGFVPVRPEWFQNNSLAVDYKFNIIDGSFTCYVRSGGTYVNNNDGMTIVGQYAGSACMHIPITGVSYASMVSGLVGAASGMVMGAGSGNIAAAATSAISAATARGDMASSNAYSSSAAFLGCRVPFLMIERSVSNYSANYAHEIGFPANVYAKLGDVPGFVVMENVHVDGISGATETEKAEIKRLLAQGVIV